MRKLAFSALWLFVFAIAWEDMIVIPGIGTMSRIVGIIAAVLGLMAVISERRFREPNFFFLLFSLFVAWSVVSYFWSIAPRESFECYVTLLQLFAFVWLLWEFGRADSDRLNLMRAYVLGAYVSVVATFYSVSTGAEASYQRYAAAGFDPNELSLFLAFAVPMSWYLAMLENRRPIIWAYRMYLPLALTAVLFTASRSGLVVVCIAMTYVVWNYSRLRLGVKVILWSSVGAAAYAIQWVVPASAWSRLSTLSSDLSSGNLGGRTSIWNAGWELFAEHPAVGVGIGAFGVGVEPALGSQETAHNTFLSILAEQGVIGFALFVAVVVAALVSVRTMNAPPRRLWIVLFATWVVGVSTLTWQLRKPTWFLVGLLAAHAVTVRPRAVHPRAMLEFNYSLPVVR